MPKTEQNKRKFRIVKFITDDDGSDYPNSHWHLSTNFNDAPRGLCNGHVYGEGETRAITEDKVSSNIKSITCPECLRIISWFKSI